MSEATSDVIREGAKALPEVNKYFPVLVSLIVLVGGGYGLYRFMDAEVQVLREMAGQIRSLTMEQKLQRQAFENAGIHVKRPQQAQQDE